MRSHSNFCVYPVGGSSGPMLRYDGAPYTQGQLGDWAPIGAEKTSDGGYLVAWRLGMADPFTIWTADSNGNRIDSPPAMSGSNPAIVSIEATFHQDLNGDGGIGSASTSPVGELLLSQTSAAFGSTTAASGTLTVTSGSSVQDYLVKPAVV